MKLSRETSRKRFLKLTTLKFTVSERPYTFESRKLGRFETDHPQSLNPQISKQQITREHIQFSILSFFEERLFPLRFSKFYDLSLFIYIYIYGIELSASHVFSLTMRLDGDSRTSRV